MSQGPADATGAVGPDDLPEEDLTLTMPRVTADEPRAIPSGSAEPLQTDWDGDDLTGVGGGRGGQFASGLAVGLAAVYVLAAIRRRARLWCATALIGLIVGIGLITVLPPTGKAETQVELAQPPNVNSQDAVLTDVALLQSRSLAELALRRLHLSENVSAFMSSFTVVAVTDQVLEIIVGAPTSSEAEQRANGIAAAFLHYRASIIQLQRQATIAKLNAELTQARLQLGTIAGEIFGVSGKASSALKEARLTELRSEQTDVRNSLAQLESAVSSYQVSSDVANDQEISGSRVLYPAAALPPSKYRKPDVYAVGGLLAGLVLGMVYAAGMALMTERLRRRDDVALAVGSPVRLSVGPLRLGRAARRGRLSLTRALEIASGIDVQRIAAQLRSAVPEGYGGAPSLAVIAMDDPYAAVLPVLALALTCARAGGQVIIADLSAGASVGRLLGFVDPGVRIVTVQGEQIALVVPDPGDLVPVGPLPLPADLPAAQLADSGIAGRSSVSGRGRASRFAGGQLSAVQSTAGYQLASAYESADLLLTVVTLDLALGAEHLPTWATEAVVIVTAGQSKATKIHSVSEMTRLAGTDISGVILVGADKSDESIGTVPAPNSGDALAAAEDIGPAATDAALDSSRSDDRSG